VAVRSKASGKRAVRSKATVILSALLSGHERCFRKLDIVGVELACDCSNTDGC